MRDLKILLLAGVIASVPVTASAQWYVGLDGGLNVVPSTKIKDGFDGKRAKVKYDSMGFVGLGKVGYSFGGPKVEFEAGYRYIGNRKIVTAGESQNLDGEVQVVPLMVNGIYEFLPNSRWHPFLGAGVGVANLHYNISAKSDGAVGKTKGDVWRFAYQAIAGIGYDFNQNWGTNLQYRYFATTGKADLKAHTPGEAVYKVKANFYQDHSILVGLTYKFGKVAPPPAPVLAAAPVAAPVVPAQKIKTFEVFFDFDKYTISSSARQVIAEAVAAAKAGHATRIDLTGHTDTVGTDRYNLALSLKRANAVKEVMVREGIQASVISAVGVGKKGLLVPTPDGVREAQNRRVEILIP